MMVLMKRQSVPLSGDPFDGADGSSPNALLWKDYISGSPTPAGTRSIQNNKLALTISGSSTSTIAVGVQSLFTLGGDFDINVDITNPSGSTLQRYTRVNAGGIFTGVYTNQFNSNRLGWWWPSFGDMANPGVYSLRLRRIGSTGYAYYRTSPSGGWSQFHSGAVSTADAKVTLFTALYNVSGSTGSTFDNFTISSVDTFLYNV